MPVYDADTEVTISNRLFDGEMSKFMVTIPISEFSKVLVRMPFANIKVLHDCGCYTFRPRKETVFAVSKEGGSVVTVYDAIQALVTARYDPGACCHRFLDGFDLAEEDPPTLIASFSA